LYLPSIPINHFFFFQFITYALFHLCSSKTLSVNHLIFSSPIEVHFELFNEQFSMPAIAPITD